MQLPQPLLGGRLIRRYKRFLADVRLDDGSEITAHCADPGRLPGLAVADAPVWLSRSDDPKRKLAHRLELIEQAGTLVAVNTANANRLAREALEARSLAPLLPYAQVRPEVRVDAGTRLDFVLESDGGQSTFVEVKNITWRRHGIAAFPDAVTARGKKHLEHLARIAGGGGRAVLLFVVQRGDVEAVTIAEDVDPAYAAAFEMARSAGVACFAYGCQLNHCEIILDRALRLV